MAGTGDRAVARQPRMPRWSRTHQSAGLRRVPAIIADSYPWIPALAQIAERVAWITCGPRLCVGSRQDCVTAGDQQPR
jgi:hypothetical protein